jgi:CBS-domain-containing membrane protein
MRLKEVMTSAVVTVPPDLPVKQAAALLVEHAIGALPVVEDGALVGIVSEADLVALEAAPDPRAHALPTAAPAGSGARGACPWSLRTWLTIAQRSLGRYTLSP